MAGRRRCGLVVVLGRPFDAGHVAQADDGRSPRRSSCVDGLPVTLVLRLLPSRPPLTETLLPDEAAADRTGVVDEQPPASQGHSAVGLPLLELLEDGLLLELLEVVSLLMAALFGVLPVFVPLLPLVLVVVGSAAVRGAGTGRGTDAEKVGTDQRPAHQHLVRRRPPSGISRRNRRRRSSGDVLAGARP